MAFSLGRDELGLYGREFQVNFKIDNMGENIKQFVAGGVGGMAAVFSGHPLGMDKNSIHFMIDHENLHVYESNDMIYLMHTIHVML